MSSGFSYFKKNNRLHAKYICHTYYYYPPAGGYIIVTDDIHTGLRKASLEVFIYNPAPCREDTING